MGSTQATVFGELYDGDLFAALVVMFSPGSDGPAQYEVELEHPVGRCREPSLSLDDAPVRLPNCRLAEDPIVHTLGKGYAP